MEYICFQIYGFKTELQELLFKGWPFYVDYDYSS